MRYRIGYKTDLVSSPYACRRHIYDLGSIRKLSRSNYFVLPHATHLPKTRALIKHYILNLLSCASYSAMHARYSFRFFSFSSSSIYSFFFFSFLIQSQHSHCFKFDKRYFRLRKCCELPVCPVKYGYSHVSINFPIEFEATSIESSNRMH